MVRKILLDPESLSERDLAVLKRHRARLAALARGEHTKEESTSWMSVRLYFDGVEEEVLLPVSLASAVASALTEVADGHAVCLSPISEELTTNEAAGLLNVSRPFLVKLVDAGMIPHRKVGTHRRVRRRDVLAYKEQMYRDAEAALQELADQAQELGLGYE